MRDIPARSAPDATQPEFLAVTLAAGVFGAKSIARSPSVSSPTALGSSTRSRWALGNSHAGLVLKEIQSRLASCSSGAGVPVAVPGGGDAVRR
jgi:hypothetical protein